MKSVALRAFAFFSGSHKSKSVENRKGRLILGRMFVCQSGERGGISGKTAIFLHRNRSSGGRRRRIKKQIIMSALGLGLGVAAGHLGKWAAPVSSSAGVTAENIERELMRMVVDGRESNVTFDEFPYYLR